MKDLFEEQDPPAADPGLGRIKEDDGLLAALIQRSRIYRTGLDYMRLLNFISRLRHMAPFNAALLHMQKPGLRFAATDVDWFRRFGRTIKEGARPLIIMWPFSPVALVYDVDDTEGPELPLDVASPFRASGDLIHAQIYGMFDRLRAKGIVCKAIPYGAGHAGHIQALEVVLDTTKAGKEVRRYEVRVNAEHDANVQFATLAHELGHLLLGHLGADARFGIKGRDNLSYDERELEAEMVSYLVCERQGVQNVSEAYLSSFVKRDEVVESLNIYGITQAAGRVEQLLGVSATLDIGIDSKPRKGR